MFMAIKKIVLLGLIVSSVVSASNNNDVMGSLFDMLDVLKHISKTELEKEIQSLELNAIKKEIDFLEASYVLNIGKVTFDVMINYFDDFIKLQDNSLDDKEKMSVQREAIDKIKIYLNENKDAEELQEIGNLQNELSKKKAEFSVEKLHTEEEKKHLQALIAHRLMLG
jgi:hypothetical protein